MRKIVKCLILNEDKFLILKRTNYKGEHNSNKWDLPGGSVDINEDLISAIRRECFEETNLNLNNFNLISSHGEENIFEFNLYFTQVNNFANLKLSHEHSDFMWISVKELSNCDMCSEKKTINNILIFMNKINLIN